MGNRSSPREKNGEMMRIWAWTQACAQMGAAQGTAAGSVRLAQLFGYGRLWTGLPLGKKLQKNKPAVPRVVNPNQGEAHLNYEKSP